MASPGGDRPLGAPAFRRPEKESRCHSTTFEACQVTALHNTKGLQGSAATGQMVTAAGVR